MADIDLNGAGLLKIEIDEQLQNKRLSIRDRLMFRALSYILITTATIRVDVAYTQKNSLGVWASRNPRVAFSSVIGIALFWKFVPVTPILVALGVPHDVAVLIGG